MTPNEKRIIDLQKQVGRLTKLVIHNGNTIGDMKKQSLLISQLLETSQQLNISLTERCRLFAEWAGEGGVDLEEMVYDICEAEIHGGYTPPHRSHFQAFCALVEHPEFYDGCVSDYEEG